MSISGFSTTNCSGKISPQVVIRNNGNNTVTSFHVKYRVNSETEGEFSWSGSIASLQKVVIDLPEYTFSPVTSNVFKVYSVDPNSVTDEYRKNDTITTIIEGAPITTSRIFIFIKTDNAPGETTWDIKNSAGDVVGSGGPYATSGYLYKDTVDLSDYDCYTFNMYDAGGNGLCCVNGNGLFYAVDDADNTIIEGNKFGSHIFAEFSYSDPQGIPEISSSATLSVGPNPSAGDAVAMLHLDRGANVKAQLLNTLGSVVKSWDNGFMTAGEQSFSLDCAGMPSGLYILRVTAGKQVMTTKVSIVK